MMKVQSLFFAILILSSPLIFPKRALSGEEPTLRQLEMAVLKYAGVTPEEVSRWKSRSRWAAALPHVTVGYDQKNYTQINNTIQDSISVSGSGVTVGPPESSFNQDDNFNRGFDVKATWALDELIFNRDSLSISAENRYRTIVRSQIIDELHQAYFERKKILLKERERARELLPALTQLRLEELEAKLDSLTGGQFSKITYGGDHEK